MKKRDETELVRVWVKDGGGEAGMAGVRFAGGVVAGGLTWLNVEMVEKRLAEWSASNEMFLYMVALEEFETEN
ncbi:hypothetical protein QVD17_20033 [Tagetes erecta]|uniref:Uncharacterized protein n=1 Tax=Tagetes erecta TaxID=13708 RepID=A0AAD8NX00_TARER|nr:hypothetical protein QVD17_20033 [Tagetes erecta]